MSKKTILQLSDLHFRRSYEGLKGQYGQLLRQMTSPLLQAERLLAPSLVSPPDVVVLTGDLTEQGEAADFAALKQWLQVTLPGVPFIATPGNHDCGDGYAPFETGFSPVRSALCLPGLRIVAFPTGTPGVPDGVAAEEPLRWLEEQLALPFAGDTLLLTHHHLLPDQFVLPPARHTAALEALVQKNAVAAVLTGHTHHYFEGTFGGKPYFTADSLAFSVENESDGALRFEERPGATLFTLEEGRLRPRRLGDDVVRPLGCMQTQISTT